MRKCQFYVHLKFCELLHYKALIFMYSGEHGTCVHYLHFAFLIKIPGGMKNYFAVQTKKLILIQL